ETKRSGGTSTQRPPPAAGFFITHCLIMLTIRTIVASPGGGHRPRGGPLLMTTTRNTPMNPVTPTSAMSRGGTFMRPGAMAWGHGAQGDPAVQDPATPAAIEDALATAVKDPDRVTALLDELSRGRLWLPLPDASPVTDGSAVLLPTVTYLGAEFVPAFTSAERLAGWPGKMAVPAPSPGEGERLSPGDGPFAAMPHIVVPAAGLARRMPPGVGIALNPGAGASVPISPEGVGYLAAAVVVAEGTPVRVGRPPADPVPLLSEVRSALSTVPGVRQASRA